MTIYKSIGLNIDWTIGPLDYFLDHFLDPFLGLFFFWTILSRGGEGRPQVLRGGGRQTVVTEGGVQDGLVERR